jgi:hypothetical protein
MEISSISVYMDTESSLAERVRNMLDQSGVDYDVIDWRCPPTFFIYNGQPKPQMVKGVRNLRLAIESILDGS